jgi:hypothetical protein
MPATLATLLEAGTVIFDGAMGTELYKHNHFVNTCFDELCLKDPDTVRAVHKASKEAGAQVLTTNSFGANRYKLADHLLADRTREIAAASAWLAREVAGEQLLVAGSIGPLGRHASGAAFSGAEALLSYVQKVSGTGVRIIAGIWPLASYGNALFLNNELPGIVIPPEILERMRQAGDKESARQTGIDIARDILAKVRPYLAGVQVSAPFGNVDTALAVLA